MNARGFKPSYFRKTIILSSPMLIDLIRAVHEKGVPFRFRARGLSMHPAIKDGDRIVIDPPGAAPEIGDIAAFVQPKSEKLAVHRIIGREGNAYLLKGDNSPEQDGYIPETNILGLVRVVERGSRLERLSFLLMRIAERLFFPFRGKLP